MSSSRRLVYVLKNHEQPCRYYTGVTSDIALRVEAHNAGHCSHTATGRPWNLDVIIEFRDDERRALAFEGYLKSAPEDAVS